MADVRSRFSFPAIHPDYGIELAAYNAGQRGNPPCEGCAYEIPDGGLTGARLCPECTADLLSLRFLAPRSRKGLVWKWSGQPRGERLRMFPLGWDWPIWVTLDELRTWKVISG